MMMSASSSSNGARDEATQPPKVQDQQQQQLRFRGGAAGSSSSSSGTSLASTKCQPTIDSPRKDGIARRVEISVRGPSLLQRILANTNNADAKQQPSPHITRGRLNIAAFADAGEDQVFGWQDADYCLYFELVRGAEDTYAHGVVEAASAILRDVGCHVRVFALQQCDAEIPASSQADTQAYVVTICSAFMSTSPTKESRASFNTSSTAATTKRRTHAERWNASEALARVLPPRIAQHPAFKLVTSLGDGAARSQQLTRLILKEIRLERDFVLANGTVLLHANQRLIHELLRHEQDGVLRVQVFPLHRDSERDRLIASWRQQFALQLPLTDVFSYLGPQLAMYFAWLEFYTKMLLVPAVAGVVVFALGLFHPQEQQPQQLRFSCFLSLGVSIGTSVFVDFWRRRQREVEYKWKYQQLLDTDAVLDLETRPQFRGEWMTDAVTKQRVYDFPHHKQFTRQLLAIPLILAMCALVGAYVVALHTLSEHLRAAYPGCYQLPTTSPHTVSAAFCLPISQSPGVLNAISIQALDSLYQKLARRLNEFENYRTTMEFEDHLVMKRMPFHFVNSNATLWFLAFYVRDLDRVRDRLWILMVLMQLLDNFKEVGLPFVVSLTARQFTSDGKRRRSINTNTDTTATYPFFCLSGYYSRQLKTLSDRLHRVLMQKRQAHYVDTFADYKEMMIQYGYVALYTAIFPLAPFFAWLNNVIESRSDFFKIVNSNGFQRPLVQHAHGIGVWERVLVGFSVVAVLINCAFVWTYEVDKLLPMWSDLSRFMVLVAVEHLVFFIRKLLNLASPRLPTWIQNEKRLASLTSTHAQLLSPRKQLCTGDQQHSQW